MHARLSSLDIYAYQPATPTLEKQLPVALSSFAGGLGRQPQIWLWSPSLANTPILVYQAGRYNIQGLQSTLLASAVDYYKQLLPFQQTNCVSLPNVNYPILYVL